jgi:soluble lytic murein transglycosylase
MARFADTNKEGSLVKTVYFLATAIAIFCFPLSKSANATTSDSFDAKVGSPASPIVLNDTEKKQYSAILSAIKNAKWDEAAKLLAAAPKGPMSAAARAEYYLAPSSPRVEAAQLEALLKEAPYLPQAEQLERMAIKRGVVMPPERPGTQKFSFLGSAPHRDFPEPVSASGASELRSQIQLFIKNDDPTSAEAKLNSKLGVISPAAQTELQYRIAWSYYIENDDVNAQRMAGLSKQGQGEWAVYGHWVHALASWRQKNYTDAYTSFDVVTRNANNDDLRAASLYWSARAAMAIGKPQLVQSRLQNAARLPETFYGLLASETLGMEPIAKRQARNSGLNWGAVKGEKNVQIAVGFSQIGENKLADEAIRFQARIGNARNHNDLAQLAGALNLPATQLWLGHYGPVSGKPNALARYPMPSWKPSGGWRIDPALAFAHTLQESQFRVDVISTAGARGLMQVRPGTAGDMARDRGASFSASDLDRPSINLEYGQSYIEKLRDSDVTGGLLPKVIAAYNAGPTPIARWNTEIRDNGDPLLFMESIPYWETRGYVTTILRNYWIYEMREGKNGGSMTGLAQYLWPKFPTKNGSIAVHADGSQRKKGETLAYR